MIPAGSPDCKTGYRRLSRGVVDESSAYLLFTVAQVLFGKYSRIAGSGICM